MFGKPLRPVVDCAGSGDAGKSRTRQSESAMTDINACVRKYRKTGALTGCLQNTRKAIFGDFSESPQSFLDANVQICNARQMFSALPSRVRERFGNDPVALLKFLADPANTDEAVSLGLCERPSSEAPQGKPATKDAALVSTNDSTPQA